MQSGQLISYSPSFNSYSSSTMAEIAARVVEEYGAEITNLNYEDDGFSMNTETQLIGGDTFDENSTPETKDDEEKIDENDDSDEDGFEFSFVTRGNDSTTISADEIFYNGQIRPTFPVFGKELSSGSKPPAPVRLPLRSFLIEERRKALSSSSTSSSEADGLEGVAPGTYCVWTPKRPAAEVAVERKKSSSTGTSSKRWRLRELLGRSFSDGKDTFVFLKMPSKREEKVNQKTKATSKVAGSGGKGGGDGSAIAAMPNKTRDVGFIGNVNGLSKRYDG